jgi:DNA-binding FrmR family transcriptional regulator
MKTNTQRLNNVIGQVEGVKKMMENKEDCIKILTQLKAVRSAVNSVIDNIFEEQLDSCMSSLKDSDKKLIVKIRKYAKNS